MTPFTIVLRPDSDLVKQNYVPAIEIPTHLLLERVPTAWREHIGIAGERDPATL